MDRKTATIFPFFFIFQLQKLETVNIFKFLRYSIFPFHILYFKRQILDVDSLSFISSTFSDLRIYIKKLQPIFSIVLYIYAYIYMCVCVHVFFPNRFLQYHKNNTEQYSNRKLKNYRNFSFRSSVIFEAIPGYCQLYASRTRSPGRDRAENREGNTVRAYIAESLAKNYDALFRASLFFSSVRQKRFFFIFLSLEHVVPDFFLFVVFLTGHASFLTDLFPPFIFILQIALHS